MAGLLEKLSLLETNQSNQLKVSKEATLRVCRLAREAILIIRRCYEIFPGSISFSFNGGKDSTVVLHLMRMAVAEIRKPSASDGSACDTMLTSSFNNTVTDIKAFYFKSNECFEEEAAFIESTNKRFNVDVKYLDCAFKDGLKILTEEDGVKVIAMGTRRSDPHGKNLERLSPSSPGWPNFLRLNPCLDWTYADIWNFLRLFEIPYCKLYDQGYTSIGSKTNTIPNVALKVSENKYKPAYMLEDTSTERVGSRK